MNSLLKIFGSNHALIGQITYMIMTAVAFGMCIISTVDDSYNHWDTFQFGFTGVTFFALAWMFNKTRKHLKDLYTLSESAKLQLEETDIGIDGKHKTPSV